MSVKDLGPNKAGAVSTDAHWSPETKRYVLTLSLFVLGVLLYLSRGILPLLVWAMLIAFILNPLVNVLTRIYIPRILAVIIVYLLFLAALIIVPAIVIPLVIEQVLAIRLDPQAWAVAFYEWLFRIIQQYTKGHILGYPYDFTPYLGVWLTWLQSGAWVKIIPNMGQIVAAIQSALSTAASLLLGATGFAGAVVLQVFASIFAFFLTLLYTFYLLLVAPRLRIGLYELFPPAYQEEIACLIDQIAQTWRRYLRGQLFLCLVIFLLTWIGLLIIGMPGAFTLALIAGALEIIPNLGPVLATIPAVAVALLQGSFQFDVPNWQFALITLGLYTIIQQLENNLLVPRIVGSAVNVHPFLVLVGIVVGAQVGGVLGAFLAAPTLATLRILAGYVHAHLLDRPPFPELLMIEKAAENDTMEAASEEGATRTEIDEESVLVDVPPPPDVPSATPQGPDTSGE